MDSTPTHFDVPYNVARKIVQLGRKTGTKAARLEVGENGEATGKVTLRNGRGENRGSFTVTGEDVKVHKAPVKKAEAEATVETTEAE